MSRSGLAVLAFVIAVSSCTGSPTPLDVSPGAASTTASSSGSPTATSGPPVQRWSGTIASTTSHDLYVGGRCETDWRTTLTFRVVEGRVRGAGTAVRVSTADPCPFPVAQLEIRSFQLRVAGTLEGGRLDLRLRETSSTPSAGADDLGGFRRTALATALHLRARHGAVSQRVELSAPDGDRGTYASNNLVRLRCGGC